MTRTEADNSVRAALEAEREVRVDLWAAKNGLPYNYALGLFNHMVDHHLGVRLVRYVNSFVSTPAGRLVLRAIPVYATGERNVTRFRRPYLYDSAWHAIRLSRAAVDADSRRHHHQALSISSEVIDRFGCPFTPHRGTRCLAAACPGAAEILLCIYCDSHGLYTIETQNGLNDYSITHAVFSATEIHIWKLSGWMNWLRTLREEITGLADSNSSVLHTVRERSATYGSGKGEV